MALEAREALSGISGSISIVAWLFLLLPQLWENYQNQHAEGLSLAFLIVWALGDVANLGGSIWANLLPMMVALGVYFCILDSALLAQTFYYRAKTRRARRAESVPSDDPTQPLLSSSNRDASPPALRRLSTASSKRRASLAMGVPLNSPGRRLAILWAKNLLAVLGVCVIGAVAWAAAWQTGWWEPTPTDNGSDEERNPGAEMLGYLSAVLYLGARLPQIWKNYKDQSCEGLSLLFFVLSTLGNGTFGLQILFHSLERQYVLKNVPWLIGSLGTIAEDVVIFIQFQLYKEDDSDAALLDAGA